MVRSNLYELVHSKDVAMIKNQLSLTATNGKKGEVVDVNVAPVVKENVEKSGKLCPGAKRSFLCRMKRGAKLENFEKPHTIESSETSSNARKTKGNVPVDEKNHILSELF